MQLFGCLQSNMTSSMESVISELESLKMVQGVLDLPELKIANSLNERNLSHLMNNKAIESPAELTVNSKKLSTNGTLQKEQKDQ